MTHNFKRFPELTNKQMQTLYFSSPHKQITEDFKAKVVKVIDGDTIRVTTSFRNFEFPIRMLDTNAPEMNEGGQASQKWLEGLILNKEIEVRIKRNMRVGKYGRLLGIIFFMGLNLNQQSIREGRATPFTLRDEGKLPDMEKELNIKKWF